MGSIDSVQLDCTVGLEGTSLGNFIAQSISPYAEQINAEQIFTKPLNHPADHRQKIGHDALDFIESWTAGVILFHIKISVDLEHHAFDPRILLVMFHGYDTACVGFIDAQTKTAIVKKLHGGFYPFQWCVKRIRTDIEIELRIALILRTSQRFVWKTVAIDNPRLIQS